MKAPDKIYLQTCGDCPGFECESCQFQELSEVTWSEDRIYEKDIEYIRKDSLLEWAKDMKEANDGVCDTSYYQEFIDKLESM